MAKEKQVEVVKLSDLVEYYNVAQSNYTRTFRKMSVLDAVDRSKLWQTIGVEFPKYQILPDTNWVSYIKSNLIASIYTVAKSAAILPTSDEDREVTEYINVALEHIWDTCDIGYYQLQAGSNAALFNIGVTQIGWDADVSGGEVGTDTFYKGNVIVKNIHPLKYMRDPFAESLATASYCVTWEDYHKSVILADPRYREKFKEYCTTEESAAQSSPIERVDPTRATAATARDYYRVYVFFARYTDEAGKSKIAEIHTVNNSAILYRNDDIKPAVFPFVELFCNLPEGEVVGTSEPAKILSNNIAYNILNSMLLTSEYKNQSPPKFISSSSGLNVRSFTKYGNEADHTFVVNGDASRAVHYHQFPQPTGMAMTMQTNLMRDVQTTTGVDGRYTGRDTGSILTTGGMEDMLTRVTLIDTPKILNYERYTKLLTQLILANFVEFSMKRTYFKKDVNTGKFTSFEVNYESLSDPAILHYAVNISSELPKNKQRVASVANMLMEKQMQYGASGNGPELITPEEWLQMQDLPNREYMQKRMNIQRLSNTTAEVADTLFNYANFVQGGLNPDDAISAVSQNLMATRQGEQPPVPFPEQPMAEEPMMPGLEMENPMAQGAQQYL